jgi:hypothetical protein
MARPGEEPRIRETVALPQPGIEKGMKKAYNQELMDSAQLTENAGKGFTHYLKHFKTNQRGAALMHISRGH